MNSTAHHFKEKIEIPNTREIEEIFITLGSSEHGLHQNEIPLKQKQFGLNRLPVKKPTAWWRRFLQQFNNLLILILMASAVASFLLHHYVDTGVILAVVLVNALVGYIQEAKAEKALGAILSMTKTHCMVIRDGINVSVNSEELVPGDVVIIQAGDRVPADLRIFFSKEVHCDESALTGESKPVKKHARPIEKDAPLAEQKNMAFMGTMVTSGLARGVVCYTGTTTQIGKINKLVQNVVLPKTPLQKQLKTFALQLSGGILVLAVLTLLFGMIIHHYSFAEMFQAAIGIAVAAIPEGLPAIVTIVLAIGVQRMAASNALVRRLPSVEVLGSVDVIYSDKTGTLTANAMTAREIVTVNGHYKVEGEGYRPIGSIHSQSSADPLKINHDSAVTKACVIASLCNNANLTKGVDDWILHGDPTEGALLTLGLKHGLNKHELTKTWPRVDEIPFSSELRYMGTLHNQNSSQYLLAVKGAPDKLLEYAQRQFGDNGPEPFEETRWRNAINNLSSKGMRVMALAYRELGNDVFTLDHCHIENNLILVGLVGISDPPRQEAIESIKRCNRAGIQVKMITGDSPKTALAIGRELGLNAENALTGQHLDLLGEDELSEAVRDVDIFARSSPENKLQLVHALQTHQHVVAMTGDGVNDAPALRQADIGVAMGKKGTDAAKEASDFVLTDDNFSTITKAVEQGRTVYDNIVKSIIFILPTNLAEATIIVAAILVGITLPITPAQILWVNMITAVTLALALAFESPEPNVMNRPPRPYAQGLITASLITRMIVVGFAGAGIVFSLFSYYQSLGMPIEYSRTVAVNSLVMVEAFYLITCRYINNSIFTKNIFIGIKPVILAITAVIALQCFYTYLPISQKIFGLMSIGLKEWLVIVFVCAPIVAVVELEKFIWRKAKSRS